MERGGWRRWHLQAGAAAVLALAVTAAAPGAGAGPAEPPAGTPGAAEAPEHPQPMPGPQPGELRARLGARVQAMTPELRAFFGAPRDRGVLVVEVLPGSPAERAGVRVGDVVTGVDGAPVTRPFELLFAVMTAPRDAAITLSVIRDRKPRTLPVKLAGEPPPGLDPEFWEQLRERMSRGVEEGSRVLREQLEELDRRLRELEERLQETEPRERERT